MATEDEDEMIFVLGNRDEAVIRMTIDQTTVIHLAIVAVRRNENIIEVMIVE